MLYIDENKINGLLNTRGSAAQVEAVIQKSLSLTRLTMEEAAFLINETTPELIRKIFDAATHVKKSIYGTRVVLFVPLYISNICANNCLYCSFRSDNKDIERNSLTMDQIKAQVRLLLKRGHKRILLVAGESAPGGMAPIDYYTEAVKAIYSVKVGSHAIKRVNINCAPLSVEEFRRLKDAGIGTYQLFQETYHQKTYLEVHPRGPKSDPDNRISAIDRAFEAGIDDVGIGALRGLYDWRFEALAMLSHVEQLEQRFGVGPHTISVPRLEPAEGSQLSISSPYMVSDADFKKIVAVLRLAVPYTGIILSTRESAAMRDELFTLGISQISAESSTAPGGYGLKKSASQASQFCTSDHRDLEEIISTLIGQGQIPSFCAACYRSERTGEAFMNLAKPGMIKGKCAMNALITLKEYLDDFASQDVRVKGYQLIEKARLKLSESDRANLDLIFGRIECGVRDEFV